MAPVKRDLPGDLNAELAGAVRQYEEIDRRITAMLEGLSLQQFNWRPAADRWSIAQNLDHLNREARELFPIAQALVERGHREQVMAQGPIHHPWFGEWFISFTAPPYKVKIKTVARFVPPSSLTFAEVIPELREWHARLIDLTYRANGLDLARLKAKLSYYRYGMPSLSLGQWLRYIGVHELRHLWQMEQYVLGAATFPRSGE